MAGNSIRRSGRTTIGSGPRRKSGPAVICASSMRRRGGAKLRPALPRGGRGKHVPPADRPALAGKERRGPRSRQADQHAPLARRPLARGEQRRCQAAAAIFRCRRQVHEAGRGQRGRAELDRLPRQPQVRGDLVAVA